MLFESISVFHYIIVSILLLGVGLYGILSNRDSIISYILSLEIMFLAINLMFVAIGAMHKNISGQGILIFILSITAAEVAIILGLVITHYHNKGEISIASNESLKETNN